MLVPEDHVSRSRNDNYYLSADHMLRAHTSAHQSHFIDAGESAFLIAGDVYRRDEIDRSHYPIFHQMEGVRLFSIHEMNTLTGNTVFGNSDRTPDHQELHTAETAKMVADDLKSVLLGMVRELFGDVEYRWVDTYFPFTHPSFELEIYFQGEWLEVLGCGVMEQEVLEGAGACDQVGWAFGLGLERLAMVLFDIPDIRLFWSTDPRFLTQFDASLSPAEQQFMPFSRFPPCPKDIAFWLPEAGLHPNTFAEAVRGVVGDMAEEVRLIDEFTHPETNRVSHCYRVVYRSMERSMTNREVNDMHNNLRDEIVAELDVELRS